MSKFVMECPDCGRYVEVKTGLFAERKVKCACGCAIDVHTDRMTSRVCAHCGNDVVFDQSKRTSAKCPVCGKPINTSADRDKTAQFPCARCGVGLVAALGMASYTCPVCDHVNNVAERMKSERLRHEDLVSVIKYEGDGDTLVWKHPIEDFNMGSQLIVHENQQAIFFRDGRALDLFGAGRHTLHTQQLPVLEKLYRLPVDSESIFHSEIYFINLLHQMTIKWGTSEKVKFIDPVTNVPISLGARGVLNFRVANARKLLLKLVGTEGKLTRQALMEDSNGSISAYFRSVIQLTVSTALADVITGEKLDILQLDQQRLRLSAALLPLLQPCFDEYGLVIGEFLIMGIVLPQQGELGYDALQTILEMRQKDLNRSAIETETELKLAELEAKKQLDIRIQQNLAQVEAAHRDVVAQKGETSVLEAQLAGQKKLAETTADVAAERLRLQLELERKSQMAQVEAQEMRLKGFDQQDVMRTDVQKAYAEALGQMGGSGGSMLGDMAGLGVALGAVGGVMGMTRDAVAPMAYPTASSADGWNCSCGEKNIQSKFCPSCGSKKPEPAASWDCPNCGARGITAKFCGQCGSKKPEPPAVWDCPNCGTRGITAKFCGECGCEKPEPNWNCPACGRKNISTNFCPDCGRKKA